MDVTMIVWLSIAVLVVLSLVAYYYAAKLFRDSDGQQYDLSGGFGIGLIILGLLLDAIGVILYLVFLAPNA